MLQANTTIGSYANNKHFRDAVLARMDGKFPEYTSLTPYIPVTRHVSPPSILGNMASQLIQHTTGRPFHADVLTSIGGGFPEYMAKSPSTLRSLDKERYEVMATGYFKRITGDIYSSKKLLVRGAQFARTHNTEVFMRTRKPRSVEKQSNRAEFFGLSDKARGQDVPHSSPENSPLERTPLTAFAASPPSGVPLNYVR